MIIFGLRYVLMLFLCNIFFILKCVFICLLVLQLEAVLLLTAKPKFIKCNSESTSMLSYFFAFSLPEVIRHINISWNI